MARTNVYTGTELAGWFDPDKATAFKPQTEWDGQNNVDINVNDKFAHQMLYRTAGGRWVLHNWSQWQGVQDRYEFVSDEAARTWLVRNDRDTAVAAYFGPLEDEAGPNVGGRPEVGPPINIRLPQETIDHLNVVASMTQQSRASLIRHLVMTTLSETGWWYPAPNGSEVTFGAPGHHVAEHVHMQGIPYAKVTHGHAEVGIAGLDPVDLDENYQLADRCEFADQESAKQWAEQRLSELAPIEPASCGCRGALAARNA